MKTHKEERKEEIEEPKKERVGDIWTVILILFIVVAIGIVITTVISSANAFDKEKRDTAQTLSDKLFKLYTLSTCPHCQEQKNEFGKYVGMINIVECDAPENINDTVCNRLEVVPVWKTPNNQLFVGVYTLAELRRIADTCHEYNTSLSYATAWICDLRNTSVFGKITSIEIGNITNDTETSLSNTGRI